ncbi:pentatricopeptide repeat domain protein [Ceratocystis lukuohia]|uniref:Pentatricopeptide repeat domain protein n=1 Tax=Ceratocystis lukuohia TaxID=2019550 RepID=A0ABR4MQ84_9PEZI
MADRDGSAKTVRILLQEMQQAGIQAKALTYHNVLAALAIHPDYTLRNEVLREMQQRWISKTVLDECYEAIGLLRDTQYEMAFDKLETMIKDGIFIPPWVYEVFIIVFSNSGFLDEAYQLMSRRLTMFRNPPPAFMLNILELFSQGYHYDGTKLMWRRITRTNRLHPSDIVVQNVIHTGARYGDPAMILQAIDLLASRGTKIGLVQFEPLLDCYALIGEMNNALRVFSLMNRTGLKVRRISTRGVYICLTKDPKAIQSYIDALHDADNVPIATVNVLFEVLHSFKDAQTSMEVYKSISSLTDEFATSETFGYLVDLAEDPSTLVFLADEAAMVVPKLQIRTTLLHKLANACAEAGKLDLAVRYFTRVNEEWRGQVTKTQKKLMKDAYRITFQNVFRALVKARDTRAANVLRLGKVRMAMLGAGLRRELDATWPEVWEEIQNKKQENALKREAAREEEGAPADISVRVPLPEELDSLYDELENSTQFEDVSRPLEELKEK